MKINEMGRLSSLQAYKNQFRSQNAGVAPSRRGEQKDHVRISSQAKELLEAQRAGNAGRSELIAELKQSVQSGAYFVSADKIAEKMIAYFQSRMES